MMCGNLLCSLGFVKVFFIGDSAQGRVVQGKKNISNIEEGILVI
jgi:hypothetical protein